MSSGLKKRMALLLACAMMFTSVDSSILTASAMEVVEESEHVHTEEGEHENEGEAEILEEVSNFAGEGTQQIENNPSEEMSDNFLAVQNINDQLVLESIESFETEPELSTETDSELTEESAQVSVLAQDNKLTDITDIITSKDYYISGLDYRITEGTSFTLKYSDGTSKNFKLDARDTYIDEEHEEHIVVSLKKEGDEANTYRIYQELQAGDYALQIEVDGQTFTSDYVYHVKDMKDVTLPTLSMGEVTFTGIGGWDTDSPMWYQFTAPADGKYLLDIVDTVYGNMVVYEQSDADYTQVSVYNYGFKAKKDKTYYLGFNGRWNNDTQQYEKYTCNATLKQIKAIKDVSVVSISKAVYLAGLDNYIIEGSTLQITYEDNSTETITLNRSSNYTDSEKNAIWVSLKKSGDEEQQTYDVWNSCETGKYALQIEVDGQIFTSDYVYQVKEIKDAELPTLSEGTVTITSKDNQWNWYQFKAPETGTYRIKLYSFLRVMTQTEDGFEEVMVNGGFSATKDSIYYLAFSGCIGDDEGEDIDNWSTELFYVPVVTKVEVFPNKQVYEEKEDDDYIDASVKLTYDDGTSQTLSAVGLSDTYGTYTWYQIKDNSDVTYDRYEPLEAGTYIVRVGVGTNDDVVYDEYEITVKQMPTPFNGQVEATELENKETYSVVLDSETKAAWFSYTAKKDIRVIFQSYGEEDTYVGLYDKDGNQIAYNDDGEENSNFLIQRTLLAGETCYFKARMYDNSSGSFRVSLTECLDITDIKVTEHSVKTVYLENHERIHPDITAKVTYSDGSDATLSVGEKDQYYNLLERRIVYAASKEEVEDELEAGKYLYQIVYGDTVIEVAEFQVLNWADYMNNISIQALENGKSYTVNLEKGDTCKWFSYTASADTMVLIELTGESGPYVDLYDSTGNWIADNDDINNNFKLKSLLLEGEKYYYKVQTYGNELYTTISFVECQEITALEVVSHEVKANYVAGKDIIFPDVRVKATYSDATTGVFSVKEKDRYDNEVSTRIVDAASNEEVMDYGVPGEYLYQVVYGEIVLNVAPFQVVTLSDYIKQPVISGNGSQAITAQDGRLVYKLSVDEQAIYKLEANVSFEKLMVYDAAGNETPVRQIEGKYWGYAVLDKGIYYVKADLKSKVSSLKVSAEKVLIPAKLSVKADSRTLIAGLDELSNYELSTRVEYSDGQTITLIGGVEDVYGNYYDYKLENSSWQIGEKLPVGTYKVIPTVVRTGSSVYATGSSIDALEKENLFLEEQIKNAEILPATIKVVAPDLDSMPILAENVWTTVKGGGNYLYRFTASEAGTYCLELENGQKDISDFYRVEKDRLSWAADSEISVKSGETVVVEFYTSSDSRFRMIQKDSSSVIQKEVKSIELIKSKEWILSSMRLEDVVQVQITYTDLSQETYEWDWSINDLNGNDFDGDYCRIVKDNEYIYRVSLQMVQNPDIYAEIDIPYKRLQDVIVPVTAGSVKSSESGFYSFEAETDGEYTFTVQSPMGNFYAWSFEEDYWGEIEYDNDFKAVSHQNAVAYQNTVYLNAGECYNIYVEVFSHDTDDEYILSVMKQDRQVKDIKVVDVPETAGVYSSTWLEDFNYYEWIKVEITYEDGGTETIAFGEASEQGKYLTVEDSDWISNKKYRICVVYGDYKTYVDIPAKSWDDVLKVEEEKKTELTREYGQCYVTFTPEHTGDYRFCCDVEENHSGLQYSRILGAGIWENASGDPIVGRYGEYRLTKDKQYNVWFNSYVFSVLAVTPELVREVGQEHEHAYAEKRQDPTCTAAGYTEQRCTICNAIKEGSHSEIPATGHDWKKTTIIEATETTVGAEALICKNCKAEKENSRTEIPMTGHTFGEWATTKDATCTADGERQRSCTNPDCKICKAAGKVTVQKDVIPATGHKLTATDAKAATCTAEGTKAYWTCGTCHKVYADVNGTQETTVVAQKLSKTGHSFGDYKVTKQPTVLEAGTKTRTCANCNEQESQFIAKLDGTIELTTKKIPLQIKKSVELSKIVTGLSEGDSIVSCTSDAVKIAAVNDEGKVTGKKAGTAKITIKLASGISAVVTVAVQKKVVATSSIKNVTKKLKLQIGEKYTLQPVISPITTTDKLSYSTSNKKIVTVTKKGVIEAKKSGTAKITVQSGKKKLTVTVTVEKKAPTGMTGVPETKTLKKGKSFTLKPKLIPSGAEAKISYKSSNKKIVTVTRKGKVTAKRKGTATITVTVGKVTCKCKITVQ